MLYIIGIGMDDEQDISLRGLEAIKKCDTIYLEHYTSTLVNFNQKKLEALYGKPITLADRSLFEEHAEEKLIIAAKEKNIALLIVGSPFAATTHHELLALARNHEIPVSTLDNASIFTALGLTGLSLYKFGRTTTIPFDNESVKSPYDALMDNQRLGLHTLILLDIQINEKEKRMMTAQEGAAYLVRMGCDKEQQALACAALGSRKQSIHYGSLARVQAEGFPQCLIIPGKLHFTEEEALTQFQ